jgi:cytidyltransferase-like protein
LKKIIGVKSGTFTILTRAHVECLRFCKSLCDKLIVVLNEDQYLIDKKGFCAVPAWERKEVLLALTSVDEVRIYGGPNEQEILKQIRLEYPDETLSIFHSVGYHNKEFIPGDGLADRLVFCPNVESSSTSDIMERIIKGTE